MQKWIPQPQNRGDTMSVHVLDWDRYLVPGTRFFRDLSVGGPNRVGLGRNCSVGDPTRKKFRAGKKSKKILKVSFFVAVSKKVFSSKMEQFLHCSLRFRPFVPPSRGAH